MVDKTEALVNEARKSVEARAIANLKLLIKQMMQVLSSAKFLVHLLIMQSNQTLFRRITSI